MKNEIREKLISFGLEKSEAVAEAELVMSFVTGLSSAEQIIFQSPVAEKWRKQALDILGERSKRVPLQYVLGYAQFMGMKFRVEPGVFIPRADTEVLVETTIELVRREKLKKPYLMDIGTGSGAIAVALAKNIPDARILAVEISETPYRVACQNAESHGVAERVQVVLGNWRENVPLDLDVIVSNPPYIPRKQKLTLAPEIAWHEPEEALFGEDDDGLSYYREMARLIKSAFNKLAGGWIVCEIGEGQASDCVAIFEQCQWYEVSVKADLNGIPRVLSARATENYFS